MPVADDKKTWIEPELIVIVRNKPEEAVLAKCKDGTTGSSWGNVFSACMNHETSYCSACLNPVES